MRCVRVGVDRGLLAGRRVDVRGAASIGGGGGGGRKERVEEEERLPADSHIRVYHEIHLNAVHISMVKGDKTDLAVNRVTSPSHRPRGCLVPVRRVRCA